MIFYTRKQTNGPPGTDQGLSTASYNSHHAVTQHCYPEGCNHPPPLSPFLLAQNLSSKQIAPTDNMRPKSTMPKSIIGGQRVK